MFCRGISHGALGDLCCQISAEQVSFLAQGEMQLETSTGRASNPRFSTWLSSQNCKWQQQKLVTTVGITGVMLVCLSTLKIEFGHHSTACKCEYLLWATNQPETDLSGLETVEALCVLLFSTQRLRSIPVSEHLWVIEIGKGPKPGGSEGFISVGGGCSNFQTSVTKVSTHPCCLCTSILEIS